jgi:hypothetical protein
MHRVVVVVVGWEKRRMGSPRSSVRLLVDICALGLGAGLPF